MLSIGVYPDVTLAKAREKRYEARKLLADHIDPSENRKAITPPQTLPLTPQQINALKSHAITQANI